MSQGKYSPICPYAEKNYDFCFDAYGQKPAKYSGDPATYDERTMFPNFDDEGFDSYGYSCFDKDGNYLGIGCGVDRLGYTESDYLCMDADDYWCIVNNADRI